MKTKLLQKEKKRNHFYNDLGIYNFKNIFNVSLRLILFTLMYQFLFLIYQRVVTLEYLFENFENILKIYISKLYEVYISIAYTNILDTGVNLFLLPIYFILLYIFVAIYMYLRSKDQLKLSSLSLENYMLKRKKSTFYLILKYGEELDFDYFNSIKSDFKQIFNIQSEIYISRHRNKDIKIELKKNFPTPYLEWENMYQKLKNDKLYLGYKVLHNEIIDNYIDFNDFQRVSITGTSGGGKSNLINLLIYSLLYNISTIEQIIFCDFKGALESQPLLQIAKKYNLNITTCSNLESLHKIMQNVSQINDQRMEYNRVNNLKKYDKKSIYLIYDEFAQIGLYNTTIKGEKEIHKNVMSIYSRLHAVGRSQKIYNITITQSFLQNSSGIPSDVKTNLDTNIMLKTDNNQSIQSVFSIDELDEAEINPKLLATGEFILKSNGELNECKAIHIPDNSEKYFDSIIYKSINNKLFIEPPNHSIFSEFIYTVFNYRKTYKFYFMIRYLSMYRGDEYQLQKKYYEIKYKI